MIYVKFLVATTRKRHLMSRYDESFLIIFIIIIIIIFYSEQPAFVKGIYAKWEIMFNSYLFMIFLCITWLGCERLFFTSILR